MITRPKVLISAFACHPEPKSEHFPGEAILGWSLVKEIERFADCHVMTWAVNRRGIEGSEGYGKPGGAVFHFLDLPERYYRTLGHRHYGLRFYYFLWQRLSGAYARKLHESEGFDLSHQITFSNEWMPSFMGPGLPVPFIWGPVGGGQKVPACLMALLDGRDRGRERMRVFLQSVWRLTPARRRTAGKASAILVCNRETKDVLRPWSAKIVDFPVNGIGSDDIAPVPPRRDPGEAFRALYIGRFDGIKGLPLAFEAFGRFAARRPNSVLTIAGEGPERARLERLASAAGLAGRVRFVPWLSRAEVMAEMRRSHVFLFPSLRDGGGAVVVEAMAAGLPSICLDIGGPGFHASPEWGFKIAPGAPEGVAAKMAAIMESLHDDEGTRLKLAAACLRRAADYYTWQRHGERVRELYARILGLEMKDGTEVVL